MQGDGFHLNGQRYSVAQFRRLPRTKKIEALTEWFHFHYMAEKNLDNEEKRNKVEHKSQVPTGSILEKLEGKFGGIFGRSLIQQSAENIAANGEHNWIEKIKPLRSDTILKEPDYLAHNVAEITFSEADRQYDLPFSSAAIFRNLNSIYIENNEKGTNHGSEVNLLSDLINKLEILESQIAAILDKKNSRSHNNPPELIEETSPSTQLQIAEIMKAIDDIRIQTRSSAPSPSIVIDNAKLFKRSGVLLIAMGTYTAGSMAGGPLGDLGSYIWNNRQAIMKALQDAATSAIEWAQYISSM